MTQTKAAVSASLVARVDELLERAEALGRTAIGTTDYYREVLGELAETLKADGIAVWSARQESVSLLFDTHPALDQDRTAKSAKSIGHLEAGQAVLVPPNLEGRLPNATDFTRGIACVAIAPGLRLAIDVRLPSDAEPAENMPDIVSAFAAIIAEFHRGRQLARMFSLSGERDRVAALCQLLHFTLDKHRIALDLANDGAALLRIDRISVLFPEEFGFRVNAVTAVQEVNRRANATRAIEQLVDVVREEGRALPWTSSADASDAVKAYLQESGAARVRVEPLGPKPASWNGARGAVIFESFGTDPLDPDFDGVAEVCRHASVALANAAAFEEQGWKGRLLKWKATARSRRTRTVTLVVAGVLLGLIIIPWKFELEAHGQVQPAHRRNIFAPTDGIITKVSVNNGAQVEEGATLAVMRNPELDLEEQRIRGEIATTNTRLAAVRAARIDHDRRSSTTSSAGQLTAEEEELKQALTSLNRQLEIVNRRLAELTLQAPLKGQVVRWDLIRSLQSRPVRQGQLLMQVVDPSGPWQIELRIPDRHVRHVLAAQSAMKGKALPVRFLFRMAPRWTYSAQLDSVNLATDLDQEGELSTFATVMLNPHDVPDLRPGSSVIAKIDCGWRPIGYVWMRELFEFLQTRVFF